MAEILRKDRSIGVFAAGCANPIDRRAVELLEALQIAFSVYSRTADVRYRSTASRKIAGARAVWLQADALLRDLFERGALRAPLPCETRLLLFDRSFDLFLTLARTSDEVLGVLVPREASLNGEQGTPRGISSREREIGELLARGLTTKQLAGTLGISVHTARHHLESLFSKLGVQTRTAAAQHFRSGAETYMLPDSYVR